MFQSKRLRYRAVEDTPGDLDFLYAIATDVQGFANSNFTVLKPQSREDASQWRKQLAEKTLISVVVCLAPEHADGPDTLAGSDAGTPIGLVSLYGLQPNHARHRSAHVSIDVLPAYQRKGYGGEAIAWVLRWGFQVHGLHRIAIESFSHNEGAGRLYERLGFVPEARQREAMWFDGGWSDVLGFAMLEHEWRERQTSSVST